MTFDRGLTIANPWLKPPDLAPKRSNAVFTQRQVIRVTFPTILTPLNKDLQT